jgi:hypothetical protein
MALEQGRRSAACHQAQGLMSDASCHTPHEHTHTYIHTHTHT